MDAIIGSESVYEEEIARWTRAGELGTEAALREVGCSEKTIAEMLTNLGALTEFHFHWTIPKGLSADARAVVCATVGRGISSGVKRVTIGDYASEKLTEVTALCVNLRSNININHVDFSHSRLIGTPQGFTLLATALKSNSVIETLQLTSCKIGTKGVRCLMEGLKSSKTITSLDLTYIVTDRVMEAVAEFLVTNVSLKRLSLGQHWTEWGEDVRTPGAMLFRSALERNVTLERLSLVLSDLFGYYTKTLLEPLCGEVGDEASPSKAPMNTALKCLELYNDRFTTTLAPLQLQFTASIIKTNKSLSSLLLRAVKFSPEDWKTILAALKENETLEELGLSECRGLTQDVYRDLVHLLRYFGTGLRKIDLRGSEIESRQGQVDEEIRVNALYRSQLRGQTRVQTRSGRLVLCGYEFAGKTAICKTMKRVEHGTPWSHPLNMGLRKVMEVVQAR